MRRIRKRYNAAFKLKAVLAVLKGDKTANELAKELGVHPMQLSEWKHHFLSIGAEVFDRRSKGLKEKELEKERSELYEQLGRLKMELEWLKKKLPPVITERQKMIEENHKKMSKKRQCELLRISRSSLYYKPRICQKDILLMKVIDRQYTETPFYGSRRMSALLKTLGYPIGRKKTRNLMAKMGLEAIYPKPQLSMQNKEHKKYPYLLRGVAINHIDQVWSADITYIPLEDGFGYLVAILDWYSRYVLAWELSNLLDTNFCLEALKRCLGKSFPEIFNTDQGAQFTSKLFVGYLGKQKYQDQYGWSWKSIGQYFCRKVMEKSKIRKRLCKGLSNP
jgi:putative transposase